VVLLAELPTNFLSALSDVLDPAEIIQDQEKLTPYLSEWRGRWFGKTAIMVLPNSTEKLAKVVALCAKHQIAITCQGGNTGLVGGQTPQGELLLNTARMRAVRNIDPKAMTITVEAGMSLQAVTDICAEHNLLFALEIASGGSASIGGAIATNAGGMGVLRYGNMRAMVLGLETVLPDGDIWHGLSGLHKDNSGYYWLGGNIRSDNCGNSAIISKTSKHYYCMVWFAKCRRCVAIIISFKGEQFQSNIKV